MLFMKGKKKWEREPFVMKNRKKKPACRGVWQPESRKGEDWPFFHGGGGKRKGKGGEEGLRYNNEALNRGKGGRQ